jgi:hypothetical protein
MGYPPMWRMAQMKRGNIRQNEIFALCPNLRHLRHLRIKHCGKRHRSIEI